MDNVEERNDCGEGQEEHCSDDVVIGNLAPSVECARQQDREDEDRREPEHRQQEHQIRIELPVVSHEVRGGDAGEKAAQVGEHLSHAPVPAPREIDCNEHVAGYAQETEQKRVMIEVVAIDAQRREDERHDFAEEQEEEIGRDEGENAAKKPEPQLPSVAPRRQDEAHEKAVKEWNRAQQEEYHDGLRRYQKAGLYASGPFVPASQPCLDMSLP